MADRVIHTKHAGEDTKHLIIDRIIVIGMGAILVLVPLFFSRFFDIFHISFPLLYTNIIFNLPKAVLFCLMVDILVIVKGIEWMVTKKLRILVPSKGLLWALVFFFVSLILSTVVSDVPFFSFFGQYEKSQGLLMQIHYFLFLILFLTIPSSFYQKIFRSVSVVAMMIAFYAVLQFFHLDPIVIWSNDAFMGRVFSTLGHPNYLGYYLLFTIPITGYVIQQYIVKKHGKKPILFFFMMSLVLQLVALLLSGSRGAIMGLVAGACITVLWSMWQGKNKKKIFVVATVIFIGMLGILLAVQRSPTIQTFFRLDAEHMRSIESRMYIWKDTLSLIGKRPFFGYGPDTYALYFPTVKSSILLDTEKYTQNADRSHNILLDTLVHQGIVGIIMFFMFLFFVLRACRRIIKTGKKYEGILCFWILISYGMALFWGFSVIVHDIYFWCLMGILIGLEGKETIRTFRWWHYISIIIISVLCLISFLLHIRIYQADHLFWRGVVENNARSVLESVEKNPFNIAYLFTASMQSEQYPHMLLRQRSWLTQDADFQSGLLQAYWAMKQNNLSGAFFQYESLIRQYPAVVDTYFLYGELALKTQQYEQCIHVYDRVLQISPLYWKQDDTIALQSRAYQERYRLFFKENAFFRSVFHNLSFCYLQRGNYNDVLYYAPHMQETVQKYQYLYTAAQKLGKDTESKKYFDKCLQLADNNICNLFVTP